jgi:hypothetical protein
MLRLRLRLTTLRRPEPEVRSKFTKGARNQRAWIWLFLPGFLPGTRGKRSTGSSSINFSDSTPSPHGPVSRVGLSGITEVSDGRALDQGTSRMGSSLRRVV